MSSLDADEMLLMEYKSRCIWRLTDFISRMQGEHFKPYLKPLEELMDEELVKTLKTRHKVV
jgi:hypothetical protein